MPPRWDKLSSALTGLVPPGDIRPLPKLRDVRKMSRAERLQHEAALTHARNVMDRAGEALAEARTGGLDPAEVQQRIADYTKARGVWEPLVRETYLGRGKPTPHNVPYTSQEAMSWGRPGEEYISRAGGTIERLGTIPGLTPNLVRRLKRAAKAEPDVTIAGESFPVREPKRQFKPVSVQQHTKATEAIASALREIGLPPESITDQLTIYQMLQSRNPHWRPADVLSRMGWGAEDIKGFLKRAGLMGAGGIVASAFAGGRGAEAGPMPLAPEIPGIEVTAPRMGPAEWLNRTALAPTGGPLDIARRYVGPLPTLQDLKGMAAAVPKAMFGDPETWDAVASMLAGVIPQTAKELSHKETFFGGVGGLAGTIGVPWRKPFQYFPALKGKVPGFKVIRERGAAPFVAHAAVNAPELIEASAEIPQKVREALKSTTVAGDAWPMEGIRTFVNPVNPTTLGDLLVHPAGRAAFEGVLGAPIQRVEGPNIGGMAHQGGLYVNPVMLEAGKLPLGFPRVLAHEGVHLLREGRPRETWTAIPHDLRIEELSANRGGPALSGFFQGAPPGMTPSEFIDATRLAYKRGELREAMLPMSIGQRPSPLPDPVSYTLAARLFMPPSVSGLPPATLMDRLAAQMLAERFGRASQHAAGSDAAVRAAMLRERLENYAKTQREQYYTHRQTIGALTKVPNWYVPGPAH